MVYAPLERRNCQIKNRRWLTLTAVQKAEDKYQDAIYPPPRRETRSNSIERNTALER
jgi:hypothetical protein